MTNENDDKPQPPEPHGHRDRGVSSEQLSKKPPKKTADAGSHDPEAAGYDADKTFEPDKDGSRS